MLMPLWASQFIFVPFSNAQPNAIPIPILPKKGTANVNALMATFAHESHILLPPRMLGRVLIDVFFIR